MYVPEHFKPDVEAVRDLLHNFGAADLVTATPRGLRATMLPMVWLAPETDQQPTQHGVLVGHFARKNNHWEQAVIGDAMAIVRGPDAYITPSWYATKREHGRVVPTWNYVIAHVYGQLIVHDDVQWLDDNVRRLTAKYEAARQPAWSVDDAPAPFVAGQLRAIVGVELRIARIEAKFKLSQNRSVEDVAGVVAGLASDEEGEMSAAVSAASRHR